MDKDTTDGLTQLGSRVTDYPTTPNRLILETFPNRFPSASYVVELDCPEFTSRCPRTHQPDFAHIIIRYVPAEKCIESKSLKLYLGAFRETGQFMESTTCQILDDLVAVCAPKSMDVVARFYARGGIAINVTATHRESSNDNRCKC